MVLMTATFKNGYITLDKLTMGENPRLPTNLDIPSLARSISDNGLLEPIHIWFREKGVAEVIRGHRRTMALSVVRETNPERFKELFPNGIECVVWENLDEKEAVRRKLDHSGQVTLSDPYELQMSANMLFAQGFTEAAVANHLMPLIQKISPLPSDKKQELDKLQREIDEARAKKDFDGAERATKALEKRIADLYRGRCQHLRNVSRCPNIVNAALYYKACGQKPKGYEDIELPSLTTDMVKALWKAHEQDLADVNENGVPKYNKEVTGPHFDQKWSEILVKVSEKEASTETRAKAMSAKAMDAELNDGKYRSQGMVLLTKHHRGEAVATDKLAAFDTLYYSIDLVKDYDEKLYKRVQESAKAIIDQLKSQKPTQEVSK